jgi:chaperonin cofactor prefoldin
MDKRQQLDLMDKVQRELDDLKNSQTSVLKKVGQIAAHNITLGVDLLENKLPDLEEQVNATLTTTSDLSEAFAEYRTKFFSDNNLAATIDPTA